MASTSHGFTIPKKGIAPDAISKSHFDHCIECRKEIGAAQMERDRQRHPFRTEDDVVEAISKLPPEDEDQPLRDRGDIPRQAVRPKIWQVKAEPVEAVQITAENIRAVADWCGGEIIERMDAISSNEQYEIQLPSFKGMLEGPVGHYVFKPRSTNRFDIWRPEAFETKYRQTGLRGSDL